MLEEQFQEIGLSLREVLNSLKVMQIAAQNEHDTLEAITVGDSLEIIIDKLSNIIEDYHQMGYEYLPYAESNSSDDA